VFFFFWYLNFIFVQIQFGDVYRELLQGILIQHMEY